jgi:hypothetical protein
VETKPHIFKSADFRKEKKRERDGRKLDIPFDWHIIPKREFVMSTAGKSPGKAPLGLPRDEKRKKDQSKVSFKK